ncbi:MAG TPA: hypothetical protein DCL61_00965 [Cyanobacteria bacterium UBA12227]|nr:hypothetical protein [Cyanobacteria bacterium UBA12227]HAX87516.1 hypothetical protein [Cyanobacteria bacterium UBA11370]HBY76110.1 hypothetical protein [Cyanobacteria bacterium UBA11148]
MTGSPLKRFVVTPMIISASIFGVLTLPLAIFGDQVMTLQFQEESKFHGRLRDPNVATPYLSIVTVLSLAAGTASVAVTGWRQSSRKSAEVEAQLSNLAQNLKEREELLESIKLSESRLTASGLASFLDEELQAEQKPAVNEDVNSQPEPHINEQVTPHSTPSLNQEIKPQPQVKRLDTNSHQPPTVQPLVITTSPVEAQPVTSPQVNAQTAAEKFPSAQNYMAYASRKPAVDSTQTVTSLTPSEVEKLQTQLQQIKEQMESLHKALEAQQGQGANSASRTYLRVVNS